MKIKVYGWNGRMPDRSTFEMFEGDTALDVVKAMMITPFASALTPLDFMRNTLAALAPGGPALPSADAPAADTYLARLASAGLIDPA